MVSMMKRVFATVVIFFATIGWAHAGAAVLKVEVLNQDGTLGQVRSYSLEDLREMTPASFETATIWTEGQQQFTGVPLAQIIKGLGVNDGELEAIAVNAYSVTIPVSDAVMDGPIVAYERNGAEMSLRNKGPLWIVYPYDHDPSYRTEAVYARSIWQLEKIIVKK